MVLIQIATHCTAPVNGHPIRINCPPGCIFCVFAFSPLTVTKILINPPQKKQLKNSNLKARLHDVALCSYSDGPRSSVSLLLRPIVIQFLLIPAFVPHSKHDAGSFMLRRKETFPLCRWNAKSKYSFQMCNKEARVHVGADQTERKCVSADGHD